MTKLYVPSLYSPFAGSDLSTQYGWFQVVGSVSHAIYWQKKN